MVQGFAGESVSAGATISARGSRRELAAAALAMLAAALLLRFAQWGNPIAGLDEQLYLLIGERMLDGAIPYVDVWDRKPVGLFVLFAAIAALPGDGVIAAQVVAALAVAATGLTVALIARRRVGWVPAAMAGALYIGGLNELWGETTQTPVFYDLPVALAALLVLRAGDDPHDSARFREALLAMLLAGVAIQIKTNAVFQGGFFGAWLVWRHWRATGSIPATLRAAAMLMAAGAAPTLAAMAGYAAIGQFPAWWHANVLSVIAKGAPADAAAIELLKGSFVLMTPPALIALLGLWGRTDRLVRWDTETGFLLGWGALAIADFLAIGGYFPHYAIPLLLALCPLAAHAFALRRWGPAVFAAAMLWPVAHALVFTTRIGATERGYAARVAAALPDDVRTECMFIYEGPVAYYQLTRACLVSRFAFTAHLSSAREAGALGVDPSAELEGVFAKRPGTVLTVENSTWTDRSPMMERRLAELLAGRYRAVARLPHRHYSSDEKLVIWRRNDLR